MRRYLIPHLPAAPLTRSLLAGLGAVLAVGLVGGLSLQVGTPLLMAPFGASCVLLFSVPGSPLSQPMHVVGGHLLSTLVALTLRLALPNEWWAVALAVGLAIALMAAFRVTHPPAGADPIVVFAADPGFSYLLTPVLAGSVSMVLIAVLYHRLTKTPYPMKPA